jgi:hypothetical protein
MEKIGQLLNKPNQNQGLALRSNTLDTTQISELLQESDWESLCEQLRQAGTPEWEIKVIQMAQDMRHDISPAVMPLWRDKLKPFTDAQICQALTRFGGHLFPSLPDVLEMIERNAEDAAIAKADREWNERKAQERRPGVLATEEQYAELRETFRKAARGEYGVVTAVKQSNSKPGEFDDRASD